MLMPYLQSTQEAVRWGLSLYMEDAETLQGEIDRRTAHLERIAEKICPDEQMAKAVHIQLLQEALDVARGNGTHLLKTCGLSELADEEILT